MEASEGRGMEIGARMRLAELPTVLRVLGAGEGEAVIAGAGAGLLLAAMLAQEGREGVVVTEAGEGEGEDEGEEEGRGSVGETSMRRLMLPPDSSLPSFTSILIPTVA